MTLVDDLASLPKKPKVYYRLTTTGHRASRTLVGAQYTRRAVGGRRGKVRGFSRRSRKRFLVAVNGLDERKLDRSLFITLTYGKDFPEDGRVWKRHLNLFLKRLERKVGKKCVVWKLEYQKRGAPHFHLVLVNEVFLSHEWIASAWEDVIEMSEEERGASTHVCGVRGGRNALHYVAGYLGKQSFVPPAVANTGRVWGIRHKASAMAEVVEYRLTVSQFNDFVRFSRHYARARGWKVTTVQGGYKHTFVRSEDVARWYIACVRGANGVGVAAATQDLDEIAAELRSNARDRAHSRRRREKST